MSAFERAAALFERLLALPPAERDAELARESDAEVRALAREMLAGEADPVAGLETGVPGAAALIGDALESSESGDPPFELAAGPYRVLGVLARGGMGVVLRGRDESIGRDVAIKVLRDGSRGGEDARLRFIEEAQVAGQLEHPGIVPVHHLGRDDAGRPFFAMKLVEGQTLAELLAARAEPGERRGRFLAHFLQVCQTVAYAHARRVIHRDLKPANVMIGAFGEVQVLDWGLAKVLGTAERFAERAELRTIRTSSESGSASVSGTVMGTPRYMPPEQAQGEVERLDRRSDVFSLGAILCEILTGEPPFPGDRKEALDAARAGRLEPAHERLRRCGADPALIELAVRALAAAAEERPADAGELADGVERSLAAVEERAHAAELEAEAARARAASERRARRLTLGLTGSAALFAVILVALFAWRARERERQTLRLSGEVESALGVATERFATALAGPADDRAAWDGAALSLRAAEGLLASGATTAAVRERHARLSSDFSAAHAAARAAAEVLERDRAMELLLEDVRTPTEDGVDPYDYARMDARYRDAFAGYGIDLSDAGAATDSLRASAIAPALGRALDQWALCHRILSEQSGEERDDRFRELLSLASVADPDADRDRVRTALLDRDVEELRDLAADARGLAPESLILLAGGLRTFGDDRSAAELLRRASQHDRGDFWLAFHCALALRALEDGASDAALPFFHTALGARPQSLEARHLLGQDLFALGRRDEARAVFRELIELDPANGHWYAHVGQCTAELEGRAAALDVLTDAARLAPDDSYALAWYAHALQGIGEPWRAVEPRRRAHELDHDVGSAGRYGEILDLTGDSIGALAVMEEGLALDPTNRDLLYNAGTLARSLGDLERAEALHRRCGEAWPEFPQARCNLAGVLMDQGRFAEAAAAYEACHELGSSDPRWPYPTQDWVAWARDSERIAARLEEPDFAFDPRAADALDVAVVAASCGRTATASDAFARLLEAGVDVPRSELDVALRSAARAAVGDGGDARGLSPAERVVHARRALAWLDELRTLLMTDARANPRQELAPVRSWLQSWLVGPDLAGLRAPGAEALPEEVRADAARFWSALDADLAELRERLAAGL